MSDYDMKIHSNPDAQAWAKFFIHTKEKAGWQIEDIDESLMLGWFSNAMMAMHDYLKSQRTEQEPWCMKMNGCTAKCEDCPDEPPTPQRTEERNFCQRCGKRLGKRLDGIDSIHTCTPPQEKST